MSHDPNPVGIPWPDQSSQLCFRSGTRKEQGQFNLKRWRDMSMSLAESLERIQLGTQVL